MRSVTRTDYACPALGVGRPQVEQMSSLRTTFDGVSSESQQLDYAR